MKVTPLTLEQGIILTGYTGKIFAPLRDFHNDVERRAGRPFFTHELADPRRMESVRELYKDDFEQLMSVMTRCQRDQVTEVSPIRETHR